MPANTQTLVLANIRLESFGLLHGWRRTPSCALGSKWTFIEESVHMVTLLREFELSELPAEIGVVSRLLIEFGEVSGLLAKFEEMNEHLAVLRETS